MKIKKEEAKESQLEKLCPYALVCAESGYGNREICSNDYEVCAKYPLFNKGANVTEVLPSGIDSKEVITFLKNNSFGKEY